MLLEGKVALVTGASRGIGKAIAQALAGQGAKVFGTATSEKGAASISEYLGDSGEGKVLNINDQESISNLASEIGAVDILVNNAGITRDNIFIRMSDDEWDDIIDTNLSSIFRVTKAFIKPMLKKRWGRVVNISSVVGTVGSQGQANYAAAKAGIVGFTKSFAKELAVRNITANVIAPGFIKSDMTDCLPDDVKEAILKQIPSQRIGDPEDIAQAVIYLANASYVTGQTIHVNGGMAMI